MEQALSYVERLRLAATGASNESLDQLCFATTQATNSTWGLVYAELTLMQQTGLLNGEQYQAALHNIQEEARVLIDYPCNIAYQYYRNTRHRVDLVNLLQATDDILVHYNVLADDHCKIVAAHDGSRVFHDSQNPRVEITITPLADSQ